MSRSTHAGATKRLASLVLPAALFFATSSASALEPVALVESVSGVEGVEEFSFLEEGQTLSLGAAGEITLSYLDSCRIETISGGTLTVGSTESTLQNGTMSVETISCATGDGEAVQQEAGALAFRSTQSSGIGEYKPDHIVTSVYPLFKSLEGAAAVQLSRIDETGFRKTVRLTNGTGDLKQNGIALEPGGFYKAKYVGGTFLLHVDATATDGDSSALARLVAF